MYSITENIYYSQLSSVALLLQPEPVSHRIIQGKDWVLSSYVLSSCGLPLPPTCLLVTVIEARSYFASTIRVCVHGVKTQNNCVFHLLFKSEHWSCTHVGVTPLSRAWYQLHYQELPRSARLQARHGLVTAEDSRSSGLPGFVCVPMPETQGSFEIRGWSNLAGNQVNYITAEQVFRAILRIKGKGLMTDRKSEYKGRRIYSWISIPKDFLLHTYDFISLDLSIVSDYRLDDQHSISGTGKEFFL
jgi:hypothetical protein